MISEKLDDVELEGGVEKSSIKSSKVSSFQHEVGDELEEGTPD